MLIRVEGKDGSRMARWRGIIENIGFLPVTEATPIISLKAIRRLFARAFGEGVAPVSIST